MENVCLYYSIRYGPLHRRELFLHNIHNLAVTGDGPSVGCVSACRIYRGESLIHLLMFVSVSIPISQERKLYLKIRKELGVNEIPKMLSKQVTRSKRIHLDSGAPIIGSHMELMSEDLM